MEKESLNKKFSYRKQIGRQQRTHSNNSKFSVGIFFTGNGNAGGGDLCLKHKFYCRIVFFLYLTWE